MIDIKIINEVVKGLNIVEAERLKKDGYTNECFFNKDNTLTEQHTFKILEKQKYFYINLGGSGVFMVDREGEIFNIKGYGTPDKNKKLKANLGNINDYTTQEKINFLHTKQYNYLR